MAPATTVERAGRTRSPSRIPHPSGPAKKGTKGGKATGSVAEKNEVRKGSYRNEKRTESRGGDDENDENANPAGRGEDESGLSFAERAAQLASAGTPTRKPLLVKGDNILRDIDRAPPGDPSQLRPRRKSLLALRSTDDENNPELARQRSQYFEDAFSARDGNTSPARERVRSEAPVLAELRTNVLIGDEFTVITELSANLAVRYRRPLSSVVVTLQHNSCMCFGGSFDPAYILAIFALPSELQPTTNKRNAALIQKHMEEALGVPASRGFLRFTAVPEANLAYGGKTAAGYVDDLAKRTAGGTATGIPAASTVNHRSPVSAGAADLQGVTGSTRRSRAGRKLSVKSLSRLRSPSPPAQLQAASTAEETARPHSSLAAIAERPPQEGTHREKREQERRESKGSRTEKDSVLETSQSISRQSSRRTRRTKSFMSLFWRSKSETGS